MVREHSRLFDIGLFRRIAAPGGSGLSFLCSPIGQKSPHFFANAGFLRSVPSVGRGLFLLDDHFIFAAYERGTA